MADDPAVTYLAVIRGDLRTPGEEATDRIREQHIPALLAAVEAVLALHKPFRIYEECEHAHAYDGGTEGEWSAVVDCGDFLTCEDGYLYTICRECCGEGALGNQREECASGHDHSQCWPCSTAAAISAELPGEGSG